LNKLTSRFGFSFYMETVLQIVQSQLKVISLNLILILNH